MSWSKTSSGASGAMSCSYTDNRSMEEIHLIKLFKSLYDIIPAVKSNEEIINKINNTQSQVIIKGIIDKEAQKLLAIQYELAKIEAIKEEQLIRRSLDIIHDIRKIRYSRIKTLQQYQENSNFLKLLLATASRIPVWIPKKDEQPPPLCGSIEPMSDYTAKCGDLVAALVVQSGEKRWIVAEAVEFKNGKYDVEDIDIKETERNFRVPKNHVKPLPLMRADPITCPRAFFNCNDYVLAMYPKTTCFFKALVKSSPKTSHDGYEVLFQDDFNNYTILMIVSQRFVINYPSSI